jgi:hypothetical protein
MRRLAFFFREITPNKQQQWRSMTYLIKEKRFPGIEPVRSK